MLTKPTSAYVHIPFCTQICYYCDFSKVFIKNQPVDAYLQALIREFESYDIKNCVLYILEAALQPQLPQSNWSIY